MLRRLFYTIPKNFTGHSIEDFLSAQGYSHAIFVLLKKTTDGILLNGHWEYLRTLLHEGDRLTVTLDEPLTLSPDGPLAVTSAGDCPVLLSPLICYEDEDLLVIKKPANMPVHPSKGNTSPTLFDVVNTYYSRQGLSLTFRCINRLDRDTTGLVIVAKNILSAAILGRQVAAREISREYLAIAAGNVPPLGTIDAPIARVCDGQMLRQVDFLHGEHAVTNYKKLAYRDGLSLVSLHLLTGRTHQIRVHMRYLGYPLIGDFLYHPDYKKIKRQALHSYRLQFIHPITHASMDLTAPLPEDMARLFPDFSAVY